MHSPVALLAAKHAGAPPRARDGLPAHVPSCWHPATCGTEIMPSQLNYESMVAHNLPDSFSSFSTGII